MIGFAYRVCHDNIDRIELDEALSSLGSPLLWVHLSTNDDAAKAWLIEKAEIAEYIVESLTATETRPRCDQIAEGAFLNLRGRSTEEMSMSDPLASVRIWAVAGRVYSVTRHPLTAMDLVIEAVAGGAIRDPGDLIAEFAAAITTELDPEVADLGDLLDDCEADLDADRVFELRRQVTKVRVQSIGYRRFLAPQRAAIEKLAALPVAWLQDEDRMHLSAAADRAARMAEELDSIRERSALMHEALTDLRAEQIDQRALIISVVAMIFLPLTFLTGLLGMNVEGIPYAKEPWAFDGVVAICVAVGVGISLYFIRRHWFR
ncbi:MAG: zinc transporter ZntB [Sphingomonas sp.]|nr:zinc transporter ZntB [Sphingomonas sp.]